ncbi:hypothetical protein FDP41_000079 [Naegleria fowleri]|uniref:ATP synthase F1 complex delta/epsilon subunit N-terminal domain-containing protein n=1 Tax=Naegleria fowleri TaxID=5763 RepID=A0A6A5CHR7_NAEFO|nr:uncharacterized protein FDP41_000079 [Naegleria fowleri]KAF0985040.1 hypothetical protein FDP41_000079 [Naegleria fowleri]CAG4707886.1 unnamed protein product [Naegleria fowleri]
MLKSIVKPLARVSNNQTTKKTLAVMANSVAQKRFYAEKKKDKQEIEDAFSYIPNRFVKSMPDDMSEAVQNKKLTLTLCTNNSYIIRSDKIDDISLPTVEFGEYGIFPNHRTQVMRVNPGLIKIKYNDEKTVKWFSSGGFAFVYYHGFVQLNLAEAYKLDELDVNLVRREVEAQKELLKSRDNNVRGQAEIGLELLEPLLALLEAAEYEM